VLFEHPHGLRVERLAPDAHGRRRTEVIKEALTLAAPAARFDE
jgi:hypothetical protein